MIIEYLSQITQLQCSLVFYLGFSILIYIAKLYDSIHPILRPLILFMFAYFLMLLLS